MHNFSDLLSKTYNSFLIGTLVYFLCFAVHTVKTVYCFHPQADLWSKKPPSSTHQQPPQQQPSAQQWQQQQQQQQQQQYQQQQRVADVVKDETEIDESMTSLCLFFFVFDVVLFVFQRITYVCCLTETLHVCVCM